jgi:hypothetical protein
LQGEPIGFISEGTGIEESAMNKLIRTMQVAFLKMRAERHHARGEERDYLLVMQQLRALTQGEKRQAK